MGELPLPDYVSRHGDDAAVWENSDGSISVFSVDAFAPIVDEPELYGQIAATNSASDIYAMGAVPEFALNIVIWPQAELGLDMLNSVLKGAHAAAELGGWQIVGGHTIDGIEPVFGQAVIGRAKPENLLTNAGGKANQSLILTKPIGTGIIATAIKAGPKSKAHKPLIQRACEYAYIEMTRLNNVAAEIATGAGASSATDITGFGLAGHLHKLALASNLAAVLDVEKIPLLPGVNELIEYAPGGTQKNLDFVKNYIDAQNASPDFLKLLGDPQTSGGLVFSCPENNAESALNMLVKSGHNASVIGRLTDTAEAGRIILN